MKLSTIIKVMFALVGLIVVGSIIAVGVALKNSGVNNSAKSAAKIESLPGEPTPEQKAQYLEAYGWMVGQQAGFEMGFSDGEVDAIIRGLRRSAKGEKAPENMKEIFSGMQEYLSGKEEAYRAKLDAKMEEEAKVNIAAGTKFIESLASVEGVKKTESGLYYKIENPGSDKKPTAEDVVQIHYTGKLLDGTVFDSSLERAEPVDLPLSGVIPGFSEGVRLLGEGGKATLYIPSELGYGSRAAGPIPPGSTLTFEVELIKIHEAPADEIPAEAEAPAAPAPAETPEVPAEPQAR